MNNYQCTIESINMDLLLKVFENARRQSSDIVIIPRFLNANYDGFEIGGIQSQTIIVTSVYNNFSQLRNVPLWDNNTLSHISLYSKDIPIFMKIIKDNNLKDFCMEIHSYLVNGIYMSIATKIISTKKILMKTSSEEFAEPELVNPTLTLLPYMNTLNQIKLIQYKFQNSQIINKEWVDMKCDENFTDVWNNSAAEGSKAWIPDNSLKQFILYIAKTMFTFSKADQVSLQIANNIQGERPDMFLAKFHIMRKKGSLISNHDYYVSGFKIS